MLQDPPSCYKIPLPVTRSPFLLQDPPSCYKIPLPVTRSPFLLQDPLPVTRSPFLLQDPPSCYKIPLPAHTKCYRVVPVHLSVDLIWPFTTLRGCLFHFKQAVIRLAYSIGLKADYTIGRSAIQMLGALTWEVVEAYHIIKPTLSSDLAE